MNRIFLLAAAIVAVSLPLRAQFEGTVRMRTVTYLDADSNVILPSVSFKGPLVAAVIRTPSEIEPRGGRFILRGDRGVMWIIMDSGKTILELPVTRTPEGDSAPAAGPGKTYTLVKTGKSSTLLGFRCEEWVADEGRGVSSRIWATGDLGGIYDGVVRWFDGMSMETADDHTRWEREIAGMKLFPLLVVRSEEGEVIEREEVVAVERGSVPDRIFAEPEGYAKQSLEPDFDRMFEKMLKEMERQDSSDSTRDDNDRKDDGGR